MITHKDMNDGKYVEELIDAAPTNFCIGVGAYPEKHFEAPNMATDIKYLKAKLDAGADYIVTQMFYDNSAFFKIADGFEGHTQILALFNRTDSVNYSGLDAERTTVDHIAFAISLNDFEPEKRRLEQHGLRVNTAEHAWVRWRSLYVNDPEGNRVEFVCYDDSVR